MSKLPSVPTTQYFLPVHTTYDHYYHVDIPDVFSQTVPDTSSHQNIHSSIPPCTTSQSSSNTGTLRRTSRESHKPSHLKDYICNLVRLIHYHRTIKVYLC